MSQRSEILAQIERRFLIAIIRAPSVELAVRAAHAIHGGGIPVIEITTSVPSAIQVLEELHRVFGDQIVLGAGTVLDIKTAEQCIAAGARFVVSPTFDRELVEAVQELDVVAIPGALTPTEIQLAARAGADLVKVFPCSAVGGPDYFRALRAPLPDLKLMATGGVHLENVAEYLHAGAAAVGLGAGLVDWARLEREGEQALVGQARRFVAALANGR